jgi:hypothetical protein
MKRSSSPVPTASMNSLLAVSMPGCKEVISVLRRMTEQLLTLRASEGQSFQGGR